MKTEHGTDEQNLLFYNDNNATQYMNNGELISTTPVAMPDTIKRMMQRSLSPQDFHAFSAVQMFAIRYMSDGLEIHGYLALPPANASGTYPAVVFNRGGAGARGALTPEGAFAYIGLYASWGYVAIASNYRGQGGSQGKEEWGAGDVHDAEYCTDVLASLGYVDMQRVGLVGGSRGGMMALMMLRNRQTKQHRFKAAVTIGAPTMLHKLTPEAYIRKTFDSHIPPGTDVQGELEKRSATAWANQLDPHTPLLVTHGTGDRRVAPEHALHLGLELQAIHHPYRLIMYENADHILSGRREESNNDIRWWLDTFVRDASPLPKVGPHGA